MNTTFTTCAEKKAKQILNLLQGYTRGIRMTAILVLLLMGVSNAWGYNEYNKQYLYFDGSSFTSFFNDGCTPYISPKWSYDGTDGNSNGGDKEMTQIGSTNYYYLDLSQSSGSYKNFRGFYIGRSSSFHNGANMGVVDGSVNNCIKATGWGAYSWSHYAPPMSSVTLANNGTTILGGSGTSSKPYLIKPGTTIKVKASGTKTVPDPDATIYYDFKQSSTSKQQGTGTTYSFTASSTANTSYTINLDGFTKISSTSSTTKSATALYFKTIATYAVTISTDGNGTVSPSGDQQVGEAPVSITATANTGYKFKNWTKTGGVVIANANNATTTITATAAGTVTANFEEDLSSNWKLIGDNQTNSPFGDDYTYSSGKAMTKKSGHSTESNVYITLDIKHLPDSYYGFKVATSNSDNDKYGYGTGEGHYITFNRSASNSKNQVYSGSQHELKFIPDALGEYEFRVNYPSGKYVYVTFPTAYAVTFGKGTGGSSVTAKYSNTSFSTGKKVQSGKTVTFTQTASAGYTFKEWNTKSDGTGTKLSTNATYTHTVAATNTVYAIYTKNPDNIVYLKPSHSWKSNNAQFAVKYGGTNHMMTEVEECCEEKYYKVTIPSQYSKFNFVRLSDNSTTEWNVTGKISVPTDGKNLYDMTKIYLKPNANWKLDGARFAAYFFDSQDNLNKNKWMSMLPTDEDGIFYCDFPTDHIFDRVSLTRMNGAESYNDWANRLNQTKDIDLFQGYNSYELEEGKWGKDNSNPQTDDNMDVIYKCKWTTYNPTYSVTLEPTAYGYYTVEYNGRTYKSATDKNVVIHHVPLGATIRVKGTPDNSAEYTDDMLLQKASGYGYIELKDQEYYDHTICGTTTIVENFITKNPHTVYLRVPTTIEAAWNDDDQGLTPGANCVYYTHILGGGIDLMQDVTETINGEDGYSYYQFSIPAGYRTFCFQRKSASAPTQWKERNYTANFTHALPFINGLNCFTILGSDDDDYYYGEWGTLLQNGDYRLLYVEQVVEKSTKSGDEWKTVITRKKAHPSDIIKKGTPSQIVSLHIYKERTYMANAGGSEYESSNNPEIILQQYNSSTNTWENRERHMVFGPLQTLPGMAMAPGRRNVAANVELVYDDGIEIIKKDDHADAGSGVWNFTVTQSNGGESATIDLTQTKRYNEETDGPYYIRTEVANGNWYNYTNPDNHMTRSDVSKQHSNYSHYFCKWVKSTGNVNVKFTIANKYGYAISDTLEADRTDLWGEALAAEDKMVTDQKLPQNANVRFTWNEKSNLIHRAYIAGSTNVSDRFLVLEGDANIFDATGSALLVSGLSANQQIFRDNSNWIYYADVQMKPMAPVKVTAKYNGKTQYFIGKQNETVTLLQGTTGEEKYLIRMLYDFKTNQLLSAYVPGASDKVDVISTNLMLIRQNNNAATQLTFNNSDMTSIPEDRRAYGVIEFTKERLIDNASLNAYERSLYWISFPFDVDVSKAICFGEYGKHWIIQEYNGARRAAEGMWLESETFWDYKWDQNITLKAGKGYVLALDVDQIASDDLFGLAGNRPIGIYFPSTEYINTAITQQANVRTEVPAHVCTINRATPKGDRRIADSHWNVIGVPSYVNAMGDYNYAEFTEPAEIETKPTEVKYYYHWDGNFNAYTAMETKDTQAFQSTFAYMVQFAGQINWQNIFNVSGAPQALAARKSTDAEQEHRLRLELHQKGNKADHTFVRLQDEDGVTNRFDFNHDLCKVINAGANIYSVITAEESPVEVAANVMPIANTTIPVGVQIAKAGEYTFAMPDGTAGITVEFIDYETNTTTNLLLSEYNVSLPAGTFENRFALIVKPNKVATDMETIDDETNGVKKYIIDGKLFLQKDGMLYDAQGHIVR